MTGEAGNRQFLQWLGEVGLGRYAPAFREQEIDFDIAEDLTDNDLRDIGLSALGDRKRFLKALAERRPGASRPAAGAIPAGERRQVTVLFADIAGYTTLSSQLDPEEIHSMLNVYFDIVDGTIREHGGSIDKHIGDAVMAVFGAPVAHMDDSLRAILAALEIHRRLGEIDTPIGVHIGIASGEVVASSTGSDQHQEYTVTGSTVNLASRLDGLAEAGETYVNREVYESASGAVIGRAIGDVTVKGFSTPISVWAIDGKRDRSGQVNQVTICGRTSECALFEAAAAACLKERTGQLFYLRGEPGIGKSCLAEAFRTIARDHGFLCLETMILDFGAATGREALRVIASGLIDPEATIDRAHLVEAALATGLVPPEHEIHLYDLLDSPHPTRLRILYDAMDNETRRLGRHDALDALVCAASERQPRFIWIDNLHWADDRSLSLLLTLVRRARQRPLMVVLTTRIEGDPWSDDETVGFEDAGWLAIDLHALDQTAALEMAESFGLTDRALVEQCRERAGGNPLFLEQLFRTASDGDSKSLPATVQSVVLARMDSLESDDRRALQAASVMGQRFSLDVLRSLIDRPDYGCDELVRRALVRPDGERFLFAHALVADGVYKSLLNTQRCAFHEKVAAWYADRDAALHAQHLDRAGLPGAARAYREAAAREIDAYRYEPALQFVARGLEVSSAAEDRVALLCTKGDALLSMGLSEESLSVFQQAVALSTRPVDAVRSRIGVAAGARMVGAVDDGMQALEAAESIAGDLPLHRERAQICYYRGTFLFSRGDLAAGLAAQERAIEHGRKADDPQWVARGLSGLGDAQYAYGRFRTAYATYLRCMEVCRAGGYGQIEVANRCMVVNMRRYLNDSRGTLSGMAEAARTAHQVGNLRAEMLAQLLHGEFLTDNAAYGDALVSLGRALDIIGTFSNLRMAAYALDHQARALAGSGRLAEAQAAIDEAWRNSRQTDTAFIGARVCGTRALLASDRQTREQALADGEEILATGVSAHNVIWFLRDAIDASLSGGNWDAAVTYASRLEKATSEEPIPWCDFFIERGRALAAHGQGKTAGKRLEEIARQAHDVGLLTALPAIECALANA